VDVETARRYDESVDSWWHRFNRGAVQSAAVAGDASPNDYQFFDSESIASYASEVIVEAAKMGECVIVGRGAQCVLQNTSDAFHVFVYAPWAERLQRVRNLAANDRDAAELLCSRDKLRADHIQQYFRCNWKDPHLYHAMVNSELGDENVARWIAGAVENSEILSGHP
jgi:cytidylate kinase